MLVTTFLQACNQLKSGLTKKKKKYFQIAKRYYTMWKLHVHCASCNRKKNKQYLCIVLKFNYVGISIAQRKRLITNDSSSIVASVSEINKQVEICIVMDFRHAKPPIRSYIHIGAVDQTECSTLRKFFGKSFSIMDMILVRLNHLQHSFIWNILALQHTNAYTWMQQLAYSHVNNARIWIQKIYSESVFVRFLAIDRPSNV